MFPYEKQNLINYRFLFGWSAALVLVCILVGVFTGGDVSWAFALMQVFSVLQLGRGLFQWSPEPTAKRQFATAMGVQAILGALGYVFVDRAVETISIRLMH